MSDTTFDLGTDSRVPITAIDTDAQGNLVPAAANVFASSDETVLTLEAQADGSTVAVRVSATAGGATITGTVTNASGATATGTIAIALSAIVPPVGDVVNVELVPGTPSIPSYPGTPNVPS